MPVPDAGGEGMTILEGEMEPGDAVAFNYGIMRGALGRQGPGFSSKSIPFHAAPSASPVRATVRMVKISSD